ncbi:metallophosphoesterase family protein [Texcoconibacillus texcoconensis]|uniref:Putative phosphoesterase n=1 Tax=Texcoconibacillus texcoconensis TaxID=1095777 RepID=A0A840QQK0_9BACI|nr:metallophosphoesterase family protein [Texcoconibacillus texcoconensis]MBB5173603.1 putative phosphoesterase [Texcoconibacillus texcoconensis]
MKRALLSDIHGNATALEAVVRDLENEKVDEIAVLGDICFRGPQPKEALDFVQSLQAKVIKGNADEWIVRGIEQGEVPDAALKTMNEERDWAVTQLDEQDVEDLKNLPETMQLPLTGGEHLFAFHATPNNLFTNVFPDSSDDTLHNLTEADPDASIYAYGHIHLPYLRSMNGKQLINLGSIGLPFDGIPKASYVTVDSKDGDHSIQFHRVRYDVNKVIKELHDKNYPAPDAVTSILTNAKRP